MWVGNIEEFNNCKFLTKEIKAGILKFIKNNDMKSLNNGRHDLNGGNYVNIFEYETKDSDKVFETHKKYIDVHYVIIGEETVLWGDSFNEEIKTYQEDEDYSLGKIEKSNAIILNNHMLAIFLPNEPHKAGIKINKISKIKKAVFKIVNT